MCMRAPQRSFAQPAPRNNVDDRYESTRFGARPEWRRRVKALKPGVAVLVAVVIVAFLTLRITGLEPAEVDPDVVLGHGLHYFVRPGLWLRGEVVTTPVTDWAFV